MEIKLSKETTLLAEALISLRCSCDKCLSAINALADRDPLAFNVAEMNDGLIDGFLKMQETLLNAMTDGIKNNSESDNNEL